MPASAQSRISCCSSSPSVGRDRAADRTRGSAPEVRAAAPDLTIVTDATYEVQPEQHRVQVTVDMVLTNHLRDTTTRRYYFDHAFIGGASRRIRTTS